MQKMKTMALLAGASLLLAACNSETGKYEGEWTHVNAPGVVMDIDFKKDDDYYIMSIETQMYNQIKNQDLRVLIKDDGIYVDNPLLGEPALTMWIDDDGHLSMLGGEFKR
jgi:hypothetical protein